MAINTNRWNRIRYSLIAPLYDLFVHLGPWRRRSIELLDLRPGERVLIPGVGTGADLRYLPPGVEILAGDITPAMVERTRRRAATLRREVDVRVLDAQALPFADGSFDAVILHLILAVVPDPVAAIREADRVLRPGGRAVVLDKWASDDRPASLLRRGLNLVTNVVATDITRRLGPLVATTRLKMVHREPAGLGGFFQIALIRKEPSAVGPTLPIRADGEGGTEDRRPITDC